MQILSVGLTTHKMGVMIECDAIFSLNLQYTVN